MRGATDNPLKIVLMSATIDLGMLSGYFGGCPTMTAQGRTFPVSQIFLEDIYQLTNYRLADDSPAALRSHRDQSFSKQVGKQAGMLLPLRTNKISNDVLSASKFGHLS